MFKEFALLGIFFLLVFLIFRRLHSKRRRLFKIILTGMAFFFILADIIYNIRYIFPEYIYEGIPIGDCYENLFAYKADSEFKWQILFPMLNGRTVYMDDSDDLYRNFFGLYAEETVSLSIQKERKEELFRNAEFSDQSVPLSMVELLNYAFEPYDSSRYEERYPFLKIAREGLEGSKELVAVTDEKSNLYLMAKDYYDMCSEVRQ